MKGYLLLPVSLVADDKQKHAALGIFTGFTFLYLFSVGLNISMFLSILLTIITCAVLGYVIELIQKYFFKERTFDLWDIVATAIGSLVPIVIIVLINLLFL